MAFQIQPDAVEYIRRNLFGNEGTDALVLVIVAELDLGAAGAETVFANAPTENDLEAIADRVPATASLKWTLAADRRERVRVEDCKVVNGVTVFMPSELQIMLADTVLDLKDGSPRFTPPLQPLQVTLRSNPGQ